jgi:hypothetical protein
MKRWLNLVVGWLSIFLFMGSVHAFNDLDESDVNFEAIDYLESQGVVSGYPDGSFGPDRTLNRAELTKIVVEGVGFEIVEDESCFPDLEEGSWYAKYVCTAFENGVVEGYPDGRFDPARFINRAESLKIILEAEGLGSKVYDGGFVDVESADWFSVYVERADELNYLPFDDFFEPSKEILRRNFSEIYYRALVSRETGGRVYNEFYDFDEEGEVYYADFELSNVVLSEPVPRFVLANEVYYFGGEVTGAEAYLDILNGKVGDLKLGESGDEFWVPVWFGSEGVYEVEIGGDVFEITALADFSEMVDSVKFSGDFYTSVDYENVVLNLLGDGNGDLLRKYEFDFEDADIVLINRQNLEELEIPKSWLAELWNGEEIVKLEVSLALYDLELRERSAFESFGIFDLDVVENLETIVNNVGDRSLDFSYSDTDRVVSSFVPENDFEDYLYVIREDGSVDILENRIVFNNGRVKVEYAPERGSLYEIIEVNDVDGRALINYPVYRENVLPIKPDPYAFQVNDVEVSVENAVNLINQSRAEFGLDEVVLNADLGLLAQNHADDMATNAYVSHADLDGRKVSERKLDYGIKTFVGENIARNVQLLDAHNSLMRSAAHRVNILDKNWKKVGIGIAYDENGLLYFVQNFSFNSEIVLDEIEGLIEERLRVVSAGDLMDVADYWSMRMVEFQDYGAEIGGERLMDRVADLGEYVSGNSISGISTFIDDVERLIEENLSSLEGQGYDFYGFDVELGDDGVLYFVLIVTS